MKKSITKFAMILSMIALFSNCKKAEMGPKGETGAAGPQGVTGNANVKSKTYNNLTWAYAAPQMVTSINIPEITQDIVDNGAVIVAMETSGGKFSPLPISIYYTGYQALVDYEYFNGGVKIYIANTELQEPANPGNTLKFKVTIMAGGSFRKAPVSKIIYTPAFVN